MFLPYTNAKPNVPLIAVPKVFICTSPEILAPWKDPNDQKGHLNEVAARRIATAGKIQLKRDLIRYEPVPSSYLWNYGELSMCHQGQVRLGNLALRYKPRGRVHDTFSWIEIQHVHADVHKHWIACLERAVAAMTEKTAVFSME